MIEPRLSELNIHEISAYLGMGGKEFPESEAEKVSSCVRMVVNECRPALVYKQVKIIRRQGAKEVSGEQSRPPALSLEGLILPGQDISALMQGCSEAVVCAVTVGLGVDSLIARTQVSDMARAVIMDACASTAVENICNNFEQDLREALKSEGLYLTDRFSPGYGDLPLEVQKDIASFLNTQRRIGLIVSENYMMTPVKSVTFAAGISGREVRLRNSKCEFCSRRETCGCRNGYCS